ncbi:DUF2064 domain-containing protein [Roseovarius sp. SYSU LYC5161]|uniref:TIGR04282 family arsenosugar biosynthesis glycosyltransferase n=1 Tax=Roseovarius halophilus (ex Wu et al. 2025) TaxID=3376060 RepID=UPI00399A7A71
MQRQLIVMLKEPRAGRVKTRLGRDIGMVGAAWWFRHQTHRLLNRVVDPRWKVTLAVSPDIEGMKSRVWPAHLDRVPQGPGNLGRRMARLFHTRPPGPVCIIGADIPAIRKHHIARAFGTLGCSDAVFGPSTDGGYWLIGLKRVRRPAPGILRDVRWSSEHALTDSIASLGDMRIAQADTLTDVDTAADLRRA